MQQFISCELIYFLYYFNCKINTFINVQNILTFSEETSYGVVLKEDKIYSKIHY